MHEFDGPAQNVVGVVDTWCPSPYRANWQCREL